jgi:hypothetical protein
MRRNEEENEVGKRKVELDREEGKREDKREGKGEDEGNAKYEEETRWKYKFQMKEPPLPRRVVPPGPGKSSKFH